MSAIETHVLAKDYTVGFWRPRPYRGPRWPDPRRRPGEVFGFLGPNGAGKTTTLKLLMQLVYPTSGTAEMLGRPLGDLAMQRRLGFLPENPYFYDYLTAEELLTYFAGLFGYSGPTGAPGWRGCSTRSASAPSAAAAAQVLEGHDAARRPRAGADQRSRAGHSSTSRCRASIRSAAARCATSSSVCATKAAPSSSARTSCPTPKCCAAASPSSPKANWSRRARWPNSSPARERAGRSSSAA